MSNTLLDLLVGGLLAYLVAVCAVFLVLGRMTHQAWVALDQLAHCLFYRDATAHKTLSARCWREYVTATDLKDVVKWETRVWFVNLLFFDENYCRDSYYDETDVRQIPEEYQGA